MIKNKILDVKVIFKMFLKNKENEFKIFFQTYICFIKYHKKSSKTIIKHNLYFYIESQK